MPLKRADPFYSSKPWRALRAAFLRVNPVCSAPGCGKPARHVDHRISRRAGGAALDPRNLVALCHGHHSSKTAQVDGGFGNARGGEARLVTRGCMPDGRPLDPTHPWNR